MSDYDSTDNLRPDRRSKYRRPRRLISWWGLLLGLALGTSAGLAYAWVVNPRIEFNTEPWQLNAADRANYVAAITLHYARSGDLNGAIQRLIALKPKADPIQEVADVACNLATSGYANSSSGQRAIRKMMVFYQLQGRSGCADKLISVSEQGTPIVQIDVPTPTTLPPPASKTPTPESTARPSATPPAIIVPTTPPQVKFDLASINTFCDVELSGVIEVFVQDFNGEGIPGQAIQVRWDKGDNTFYTGLKPERGPGYADFQMEAGKGYIIEMPGQSPPSSQPLGAIACTTPEGKAAVTSYRVFFRPAG